MQKVIMSFLVIVYGICSVSAEKEPTVLDSGKQRTMAIAGSPLAPLFGGLNLHYQTKLTNFLTLSLPVSFQYSWLGQVIGNSLGEEQGISVSKAPIFFSAGLGTKFLLPSLGALPRNGESHFYLEPRFLVAYGQLGLIHEKRTYQAMTWRFSSLLMIGQDFVFDSGLFLNFGLGAGVSYFFNNKTNMPWETSKDLLVNAHFPPKKQKFGVAFEGDFNIGFAW
ncbi:MAG: hypothetical protein BWZ03_00240 [bacterium ADurb.BinA186]|nr:MAG: hypothetical protein BWZ03_00240 [bacterium ADurb.BinA186]